MKNIKTGSLRINCINPGGTRTSMRASLPGHENAQKLKTPKRSNAVISLSNEVMTALASGGQSLDAQPDRKAGPAE